uniref:DH domain-containing protein n=1 Tax=Arcella intermedia TaxID=1963864 RepID=A0A6B2L014_9EUKA
MKTESTSSDPDSLMSPRPEAKDFSNPEVEMKVSFKRVKILEELLETETSYVYSLNSIYVFFIKPLRNSEHETPIIPKDTRQTIFSKASKILSFHKLLLSDFQVRIKHCTVDTKISDLFFEKRMQTLISLYRSYINNYSKAFHVLREAEKTSATFKTFLRKASSRSGGKLTLEDYLIMPVQRIPRYVLLLDQLLRNTSSSHTDYKGLCKLLDQFKIVADFVNTSKKQYDEEDQVKKVLNQIPDFPMEKLEGSLALSVIKYGVMTRVWKDRSKHKEIKKYFLVLLSQYLVIAKVISERRKIYKFSELFSLNGASAFIHQTGPVHSIIIKIPHTKISHGIEFSQSEEVIRAWNKDMDSAISKLSPSDSAPKDDPRLVIIQELIEKDAKYVDNMKKMIELVTDKPDKILEEFFDIIPPMIPPHEEFQQQLFQTILDTSRNFGEVFESTMRNLILAYNPYCILWIELEEGFTKKKENHPPFASCAIEFETNYGNTIEHFLQTMSTRLADIKPTVDFLIKNTPKRQGEEVAALERVSEQLKNFSEKIQMLKDFNNERLKNKPPPDTKRGKHKKKSAFERISLKW